MSMNKQKKLKFIQNLSLHEVTNIKSKNFLVKLRFYEILYEMILSGTIRNKREIYYLDVNIFKSQKVVDGLIKKTCLEMNETPFSLNITNTLKGIFQGSVTFYSKDKQYTLGATISLIPDMNRIEKVTTTKLYCLVLEKDTIFSKAVRQLRQPEVFLLVCGKGYPCKNTQLFLSKVMIPIIGLFDYDPYGLDIFLKYSAVCDITRIGLDGEDIQYIPQYQHIEFKANDHKRMKLVKTNTLTSREAFKMEELGVKVELESVFDRCNVFDYIKNKL